MSTPKELAASRASTRTPPREMQTRARNISAKIEAELDAKRKELGVADELKEVPGVTTAMLVTLGENGIKTVEDLAGCATDDLVGWTERKDGETQARGRLPRRLRALARGSRGDDHAGPRSRPAGSPRPISRRRTEEDSRPKRPSPRSERGADSDRCWHAPTSTTPGRAATRRDRAHLRRHARGQAGRRADPLRGRPRTARSCPTSSAGCPAAASGSRRRARRRRSGQAQGFRPRLQARGAGRARSRPRRSSGCWSAPRSMRLAIANKAGRVVTGFAKVEAAIARRAGRGAPACRRCGRRRGAQDRGRRAPAPMARMLAKSRVIATFSSGAIGFGIGAVKCDTCCPARRPSEQRVPRALPEPRTLPDRSIRTDAARDKRSWPQLRHVTQLENSRTGRE